MDQALTELMSKAVEARLRGDHRQAAELSARAARRAEALGDDAGAADALSEVALNQVRLGDLPTATASGHQALSKCTVQPMSVLCSRIHSTLSLAYERAGLHTFAISHADKALEIARHCQDPTAECWALIRLGTADADSDHPEMGLSTLQQAVAMAGGLQDRYALFAALNNLSRRWVVHSDRLAHSGEDPQPALRQALPLAEEASQLPATGASAFIAATSMSNLASIHARMGQPVQARTHFLSALDIALHHGYDGLIVTLRLALACLDLKASPSPQARAVVQQFIDDEQSGKGVDPDMLLEARRALVRAYRESGNMVGALAQMEQLHEALKSAQARRVDLQSQLLFNRAELDRARLAVELAQLEAQRQRVRADAEEELTRQLAEAKGQLEQLVAARTAELASAKAAAEAASRAKSSFLATVSHELHTPLNGLIGMVNLASRRAADPRQIELLGRATASAWELNALFDNILDVVAADADAPAMLRPVALHDLLESCRHKREAAAQAKGMAVRVEMSPSLPAQVLVDGTRLSRTLDVLLDNAIKFSSHGPVRLLASGQALAPGQWLLRLEVRDIGLGISPEMRERLFQPFEMGDASNTRVHRGLGLGLALAKRLAESMGGRIGVETEAGQGSGFFVVLEVAAAPA